METTVLIIGGGLSGLAVAWQLEKKGVDYQLIEARDRLGGRIHSHVVSSASQENAAFDLGPSWFWPGQPRIAALINEFGLTAFEQYAQGDLIYEDQAGNVQSSVGHSSMQGSYRLAGGLSTLIDAIRGQLPAERCALNMQAVSLENKNGSIVTTVKTQQDDNVTQNIIIQSKKVILALPPRLAAELTYHPALKSEAITAMQNIPTWMAGHAKAVAIYEHSFWREAGLSGDAMSRHGPLVEMHDASPNRHGPYALFGFVGIPAQYRENNQEQLKVNILEQLVRLFGPQAGSPISLIIQDWAFELETATSRDHTATNHHPAYGLPDSLNTLWNDDLILSSTESALQFGGYIEGALEAAEVTGEKLRVLFEHK